MPPRRASSLSVCILAFAGLIAAAPVARAACPGHALDTAHEEELIDALRAAPHAKAARPLNARLWALWTDAPDARAQELLDSGMARIRVGDLRNAVAAFDALIAYCPDYAEGYNQRAFARYLRQDFAPALEDLDAALARSPRHIGALSGKALTLMGLGRDREALATLRAALALNPWLSERTLVPVLEERLGAEDL
jgi:tetratricopeptide (TPR) repeat protein